MTKKFTDFTKNMPEKTSIDKPAAFNTEANLQKLIASSKTPYTPAQFTADPKLVSQLTLDQIQNYHTTQQFNQLPPEIQQLINKQEADARDEKEKAEDITAENIRRARVKATTDAENKLK